MQLIVATVASTLLILLVVLAFAQKAGAVWKNSATEPPGPALLPWLGRIHDLPTHSMWLKFKEWADIYGPLYRTQMLGDGFVVITDEQIAKELLVKRSKIYSDRPSVTSLFDSKSTEGSMEYLPMMGRNKYWARQRKFMHAYLTEATNAHWHGVLYHEAKRLLSRILDDPDNFSFILEDMASKIVCQLSWDDPSDATSQYCTRSAWALLTQLSPAGPITNIITPLWHLPYSINPWKQAERKRHDEQQRWWMERYTTVREQMATGHARPSFTRTYLQGRTSGLSGDYEASSALGMMALISIITIAGPMYYFLIAMLYHPDWQTKVQKEIDAVCSGPPELADSPRLPILRACMRESMRWRPSIPTGVAHEVEEDDFYNGWYIPKGTRILPLEWAFSRNQQKYPDAESFRPERWLEPSWPTYQAPLTQYPTIMNMSGFGWGQRSCIGQTLARDEILVTAGALLWAFDLKMKKENGKVLRPRLDKPKSLLIIRPHAFQMSFEPRSEKRRDEILAQWKTSEDKDQAERAAFVKTAAC
ncbi:hypothetical protein AMS68_000535 [Peltaster fructicola]|uniref:Cytochrome P450 n=1 Tax=Peltaster fructicola TaxID=286661 RepID=A0A6H0XK59_9PEZI|nr:hypothetical protein AMS68_000535 [Peltaster fructicola]